MKELNTSLILGIATIALCLFSAWHDKKIKAEKSSTNKVLIKDIKAPLIETLTGNYKVVDNQNSIKY